MSIFFAPRGEQRVMNGWGHGSGDGFPTVSGSVSVTRATHLAPVFAAIRHIVDYGSTLPVEAFRSVDDVSSVKVPLPRILAGQNEPGAYGVGQWLGQGLHAICTRGNAVGFITDTDGYGYPTNVAWVRAGFWSFNEWTKQWYVHGEPIPSSRIFHVPWIVPEGYTLGLSPIEHYAAQVRAGLSAQEYADIRRGGGLPPTVLKNTARVLDPDTAEAVSGRASKSFASGKPFVHGNDWALDIPSIPPSHAQFIETMKVTALQIATIYGIDPREIGGEDGKGTLTYKTDESVALNRANNMRPYLERFETAINLQLPPRLSVRMNVDATIRTDLSTKANIIGAKLADGRLTLNEARAQDDMPAVAGGDVHRVPAGPPTPIPQPGAGTDTNPQQ